MAHRGPDGGQLLLLAGFCLRVTVGMGQLGTLDLETGDQPIFNEDRSVAIVSNGEIYNYVELRADLEKRGHVFRTKSDIDNRPLV